MKEKIVAELENASHLESFSRSKMNELHAQGILGGFIESSIIQPVIEILESDELQELIKEGKITLAMIKPRLEAAVAESINRTLLDSDIAVEIEQSISEPLAVVFSISLNLSPEMIDRFYAGDPMERQRQVPPIDHERYGQHHDHRWSEYRALMASGPVTFAILYSPDNKAVANWREQMGNDWNVERVKVNYPNSLRARFAKDSHNNLLHGSDSSESAKREIDLLAEFLQQTQK